ncbi:MAG: 8-amino-7-oxononanoate synthase [Gammaproteobacteria bacterium]|nr:8-amino-7-oxononanoate synthase [Gammaproteobacteria bacterium]
MKNLEPELAARQANHLYRSRRINDTPQGPECVIDGQSLINFCSNDYLGLANHPAVNASFRKGINRWGSGSGAAHLVNGHTAAHHALEEELADFIGRERALLFSTGYMANLGVATALLERGDAVFEDRLNHASLLDAGLLSRARFQRYRHTDVGDLEEKLSSRVEGEKLVLTDGVFSMDGDIAPLTALAETCQKQQAWLMVDDAHGLGVLAEKGRGSLAQANLTAEQVPILMATLGKAFGTFGAFVAGSEALIETLIQKARSYIYTTAIPAALAEATRTGLQVVRNEDWRRTYLFELVARFKQFAGETGLPVMPSDTPIQPIQVGSAEQALAISQALFDEGILITAIRPPTVPEGSARLRLTFSASHTEKHLQQLFTVLEKCFPSPA